MRTDAARAFFGRWKRVPRPAIRNLSPRARRPVPSLPSIQRWQSDPTAKLVKAAVGMEAVQSCVRRKILHQ